MKRIYLSVSILAIVVLFAFSSAAQAQNRPSNTELGIILGEPTGLSAKFWRSPSAAFDLGLAWSFRGDGAMHVHGDYLLHEQLDTDVNHLAFYYGLGARLLTSNDARVGARIPVGLQFIINDSRLGVFFEVVPLLDLVPATEFDINGGIGIRLFI